MRRTASPLRPARCKACSPDTQPPVPGCCGPVSRRGTCGPAAAGSSRTGGLPTSMGQLCDVRRWRTGQNGVIDATLNPGFSQVALDVPARLSATPAIAYNTPKHAVLRLPESERPAAPAHRGAVRSGSPSRAGACALAPGAATASAGTAFCHRRSGGGRRCCCPAPGHQGRGWPASQSLAAVVVRHRCGAVGALAAVRRYADGRSSNTVWKGPEVGWQIDDAWRLRAQVLNPDTTALPMRRGDCVASRPPGADARPSS